MVGKPFDNRIAPRAGIATAASLGHTSPFTACMNPAIVTGFDT